jgi:tellurite resistance protein TehA-like permease
VSDPDVALRLFSFVAACVVLSARLDAYRVAAWTLGVIASVVWLVLAPIAARGMWPHRWAGLRDRSHGAWELASVATSGLALVAANAAIDGGNGGLFGLSIAIWILAILVYCLMTWLILWRAEAAGGPDGWASDSWILMGGLAIATLAGDHIHRAGQSVAVSGWPVNGVQVVTVVTWVLASLWIPPLVYVEIQRIQRAGRLRFAGVWWAMVFPLGMYSAATQAMASERGWPALRTISLVFSWIALTAWLVVAVAGIQVAIVRWRERQAR